MNTASNDLASTSAEPSIPDLPVHEAAALFPELPANELSRLADDIRENGQRAARVRLYVYSQPFRVHRGSV